MANKLDRDDLAGELDAIAAVCYIVSNPLIEGDNRATDATIGDALHAIGCHLNRIAAEVADYVPATQREAAGQ